MLCWVLSIYPMGFYRISFLTECSIAFVYISFWFLAYMFDSLLTPTSISAFHCGLIPSFLYSLDYFYFYVYTFLTLKFQHFGGENKIFAVGVGLWTIWNTLVLFSFIARLYMCYILLTVSCFGRPCLDTMFNFTLLLILSFSVRVPLISNRFHFSLPIVLFLLYCLRFSKFCLWHWISALTSSIHVLSWKTSSTGFVYFNQFFLVSSYAFNFLCFYIPPTTFNVYISLRKEIYYIY